MPRKLVLACVLVAAALLAGGLLAGPLAGGSGPLLSSPADQPADAGGTTSAPIEQNSTTTTEDASDGNGDSDDTSHVSAAVENHTDKPFVVTTLASDGDATLVGGTSGVQSPNATAIRVGDDGDVAWTYQTPSENRSNVVAVEPAPDDGAYVLRSERAPRSNSSAPIALSVDLVRLDNAGDVAWRESVNTSGYFTGGLAVTETSEGVAVAHTTRERGVRLLAFDDAGEQTLDRTYGADARPTTLRATEDGFLLAGSGSFRTAWVLRTDEAGDPVLNETYENGGDVRVTDAVPTEEGGVLLAGQHRADFAGIGPMPWMMRVGADGVPEWSRVYSTGEQTRVQDALTTEDGLVLVGSDRTDWTSETTARFVGVGTDGRQQFQTDAPVDGRVVAVTGNDETATIAMMDYRERNSTGNVSAVELPEGDGAMTFEANTRPSSNETVYRGQNLRFERADAAGETYDLVAVPDEDSDDERHVERRVPFGEDGVAVVESATLPRSEYVIESPEGDVFAIEDGRLRAPEDDEETAFRVRRQRVRVSAEREYVNTTAANDTVTVSVDSRRSNYSVYVSATQFRGDTVSGETLRAAFEDAAGFEGVETADGRPVARIDLRSENAADGYRWDNKLAAAADAFDAGLYRLRIAAADTRDGGSADTARLVVGKSSDDPLNVTLENDSLTVPVGEEAVTNVTVSGLADGVGAMSMSARRTGDPAVSLHASVDIRSSRSEGSAKWSSRESTASAAAFDANITGGTLTVGRLQVQARDRIDVDGNETNTVTFGLDWVVDEDGTPYGLPDDQTISVEVTDDAAENGTE